MKGLLIKKTLLTFFGFATLCLATISCSDSPTSTIPIEDELKQLDIIERVSVHTANSITTYDAGEDYSLSEVEEGYLLLKFDRNVTIHSFNLMNAREISIQHDRNSVILYY